MATPGQVLDPSVAVSETRARLAARQAESDPKRHGCHRVTDVVNGVGEQRDATRDKDRGQLQPCRDRQDDKRPLYRPDAARSRCDCGVHDTMRVAVSSLVLAYPLDCGADLGDRQVGRSRTRSGWNEA